MSSSPSAHSVAWWCEQVVANAADGIIVADRSGTIRVWNAGAVALLGHPAADAIGRRVDLIIPEEYHGAHWAGFGRAMQQGALSGTDPSFVLPALHRNGTVLELRSSLTLLRDPASGAPAGAMVIMRRLGSHDG